MPLNKQSPISTWIKDFQKSDAPQFQGKTKEERRKMAIAAYYAKQEESYVQEFDLIIEEADDIQEFEINESDIIPDSDPVHGVIANHFSQNSAHLGKLHAVVKNKETGNYTAYLKHPKKTHVSVRTVTLNTPNKNNSTPSSVKSTKIPTFHEIPIHQAKQMHPGLKIESFEYSTLVEYRIRTDHKEDVDACFNDGKKAKMEGKECDPTQSHTLYTILCKRADINDDLKKHFKNAWIKGYSTFTAPVSGNVEESYEVYDVIEESAGTDLTKIINPFSKLKTTQDRHHFISLMNVRRIQHTGTFATHPGYRVERKGDHEIHSIHGTNGNLIVGSWNHSTGTGKYIPPFANESRILENLICEEFDVVTHLSNSQDSVVEKTTKDFQHFKELMQIRRVQHTGHLNNDPKFTVTHLKHGKDIDVHIWHAHNNNGQSVVVGSWNNLKNEGKYVTTEPYNKYTPQNEDLNNYENITEEFRGNESDVHSFLSSVVAKHLASNPNAKHDIAKVLGLNITVDSSKKTNQFTVSKNNAN